MPPSIWSNSKSMFLNIWCWYQVVYECVFPSPVSGRRPLDRHCPGRNHLSLNTILLVLVSYHNAMEHLLDKILSWWIWISNGFTGSLDHFFLSQIHSIFSKTRVGGSKTVRSFSENSCKMESLGFPTKLYENLPSHKLTLCTVWTWWVWRLGHSCVDGHPNIANRSKTEKNQNGKHG